MTTQLATLGNSRHFNCYVTGSIGVIGRMVSDAICSPAAANTAAGGPSGSPTATARCNAFLKAAGRWQ